MRRATRSGGLALSALVALSGAAYAGTGVNDNVEGLQSVARKGLEDVQDLQGAIDDALAISNALKSDATFQSKVIDAINIKDLAALGNLLRQRTSRSTFSLTSPDPAQPFIFALHFKTRKGQDKILCISLRHTCGPNSNEFASID